jgi:hypothetical protein
MRKEPPRKKPTLADSLLKTSKKKGAKRSEQDKKGSTELGDAELEIVSGGLTVRKAGDKGQQEY